MERDLVVVGVQRGGARRVGDGGRNVAAGEVVGGVDAADVEGDGDFADGLVGLGVLRERDQSAVLAQDAGFFAGDFGDGVAEVFLVVERDVGDDGEHGIDDVGGVETAAEAY